MTAPIRQRFVLSWADAAMPGGNAAGCTALPSRQARYHRSAARACSAGLPVRERGRVVVVVSLRGELDFLGAASLPAYLSGLRWLARARSVAALTSLLSWFEVHYSVEETTANACTRRSAISRSRRPAPPGSAFRWYTGPARGRFRRFPCHKSQS
jgi:hypothetical protein